MYEEHWEKMPNPVAKTVGPRILWHSYIQNNENDGTSQKVNFVADKILQQMQLYCKKCSTAYSLNEVPCHICDQKDLEIVHKTIDDCLTSKVRVQCGCGVNYKIPRDSLAQCNKDKEIDLSYLLIGSEQSELLPMVCLSAADPDIKRTTEYFMAFCSSSSVENALLWLSENGYMKKRRIGLHTKNLRDPNIYNITKNGIKWLNYKLDVFEKNEIKESYNQFIDYRLKKLKKIKAENNAFELELFLKSKVSNKDIPDDIKKLILHNSNRRDFKKTIIEGLQHKDLDFDIYSWLFPLYKKKVEKFVKNKEGLIWNYSFNLPRGHKRLLTEIDHVPSKYLDILFENDKREVGFLTDMLA